MKTTICIFALAVLIGGCGERCKAQSVEGDWVGGYQLNGEWTSLLAHFKSEQQATKGTLEIESFDESKIKPSVELKELNLCGSRLRFEMPNGATAISFDGAVKSNRIDGKFVSEGKQGRFELQRTIKIEPSEFHRYIGAYQLGPKEFISFGRFQMPGSDGRWTAIDRLSYADTISGRNGWLVHLASSEFIIGPALGLDYPPDISINFITDPSGEVTGLKWRHGGVEKTATRVKLIEEDVKFSHGDVTLAGTLVMPATKGPHPALVLIHGSTPLVRYYFAAIPYNYAANGVAVLFYDKRGCGQSTGKFSSSLPIETLAADAVAGVQYLKSRKEIRPDQIGVDGHSQGGWVAPAAASMSKDIAFVMAGAASGWSTEDNIVYELDSDLRANGFSEADRARAKALYKQGTEVVIAGGEGWNKWREEINKAKNEKWFQWARTPPSLIEMNEANRSRILDWIKREHASMFDPVPVWEKITVPVLVYGGELDRFVPTKESAVIIDRALKKSGNKDYTIKIFPGANHGLWAVEPGDQAQRLNHQVHVKYLIDWLLRHVTVSS